MNLKINSFQNYNQTKCSSNMQKPIASSICNNNSGVSKYPVGYALMNIHFTGKQEEQIQEELQLLNYFKNDPDIKKIQDKWQVTFLRHCAINFKTIEGQKALINYLDEYPDVAIKKDEDEMTPVHHAAIFFRTSEGQVKLVEFLDKYPNIAKMQDYRGRTPVHLAAEYFNTSDGNKKLVEFLDNHFDIATIQDHYRSGATPISLMNSFGKSSFLNDRLKSAYPYYHWH